MTEADDTSGMTTLPGGWRVPNSFTIRLLGQVRRTPVEAEVAVEMIGGTHYLRALALAARDPAKPLSAADLADINLVLVLDWAVREKAREQTTREWVLDEDPASFNSFGAFKGWVLAKADADAAAALSAVRSARTRRRITPADLRRVLDVHAAKGIGGLMTELGYSERNAYRLLARARKELP